jgi:hypothetical protein
MMRKLTALLLNFLVLSILWTNIILWKGMLDVLKPDFPKVLAHVKMLPSL